MRSPRKDARYRRAKAEGYRARSAYKLVELDDRHRLFRPGDRVVDLGAWPGGWLQIASTRVGPQGHVVGLDLEPVAALDRPNVSLLAGDVRDPEVVGRVRERLGSSAAIVLSDLAPKLTGIRDADDARATELVTAVLDALPTLLRPGGTLVAKLFMSSDYQSLVERMRREFREMRTTRPESTRRGSAELYAVCRQYLGGCG